MKVNDGTRIETLYTDLRNITRQTEQRDANVTASQIADAFEVTVKAMAELAPENVTGRFWDGSRKTLQELRDDRVTRGKVFPSSTGVIAAEIGQPKKGNEIVEQKEWAVEGHPELHFKYVEREIVTARAVRPDTGKGAYIAGVPPVSADLLLVNAVDSTPIVCEVKLRRDENALFALVQSLAAVAQLTSTPQRERLRAQYPDSFGETTPSLFDVYVLMVEKPTTGIPTEFMTMALDRAEELRKSRALNEWIRRIAFIEAFVDGESLRFELAPDASLIEFQP